MLLYKKYSYKQYQARIGKKIRQKLRTPWGWTFGNKVYKKGWQFEWDYMIDCNENENDNGK